MRHAMLPGRTCHVTNMFPQLKTFDISAGNLCAFTYMNGISHNLHVLQAL